MEINEYLVKLIQIAKDMENLGLFDGGKLNKTEFRLIREVLIEGERGKKIISSELARRLGITRSAVSQMVTKLEKQDVLMRTESPIDKKIAYVQLSDKAYGIFETQCRQANATMERVVEEMGEEKLSALVAAYDEFLAVFQKVTAEKS